MAFPLFEIKEGTTSVTAFAFKNLINIFNFEADDNFKKQKYLINAVHHSFQNFQYGKILTLIKLFTAL